MWDAWKIGILISASTNADQMFTRIGNSAKMASLNAELARGSITKAGAAAERNQLALANANSRLSQMSGLAAGAVATLGTILLTHGVTAAAQMELALSTVGVATGATTDQMKALGDMVVHVSGQTAQSTQTIAQEMATAARAGLNSFQRLSAAFPQIAKFADVQSFAAKAAGRDADPNQMVSVGVQFAHYFQAYSDKSKVPLSKMLDKLNALMFTQPEDINKLLTQGKYFIPLATRLHMPIDQIMGFLASMGQTGFLRGKGGTGIQNTLLGAINVATMTPHLQGARKDALVDLGLIDKSTGKKTFLDANGNVDSQLLFGMLTAAGANMQSTRFIGDLSNAFGKQATQFLSVFTGAAVQKQLTFIQQAMGRMGTVEKMFSEFFKDLIPQVQRFATDFWNVFTNIARPVLPYLTKAFTAMADALGRLGDWFAAHPRAGLTTAIAGFGATALAAAYAVKQLFNLNIAIDALAANARANAILNGGTTAVGGGGSVLARAGKWITSPITSGSALIGAGIATMIRSLVGTSELVNGIWVRQGGLFAKIFGTSFFTVLERVGLGFTRLLGPLTGIGGFLARFIPSIAGFGVKFIPLVGWLIAAGQAVKFWMDHPFQIGEFIGKIVGWFKFHLIPDTITAVSTWVPKIIDFFRQLGPQIIAALSYVFHPNQPGGFFDTLKADWEKNKRGFVSGLYSQMPASPDDSMPRQNLHGDIHIHINGGAIADPKKHAKAVAKVLSQLARHALHETGAVPSHPHFSRMEFATN